MTEIRILVVDDHPLVREGTLAVIEKAEDMRVVAVAGTGYEALQLVQEQDPDIVVLDVRLPDMSGVDVARTIACGESPPAIVVLTAHDTAAYRRAFTALGASGFLGKTASAADIVATIRTVATGATTVDYARVDSGRDASLTCREEEVLRLLAAGLHNQEIATSLCVSVKTVEFHLRRLFVKLQVRSRVEAATHAQQFGLLD